MRRGGPDGDPVRGHFIMQAAACEALGSPFTARLCRALAQIVDGSTKTGSRTLAWPVNPRDDALALRLCGGLHAVVLSGSDPALSAAWPPHIVAEDERFSQIVAEGVARNDGFLEGFLDLPPQTNEIARSAMLLPGFLAIARGTGLPMAIAEIGSSAGLNLNFDRFRHDFAGASWGDPASGVRLSPEIRGRQPPLEGTLEIVSRVGSDIAPLDIRDPRQLLRLRSYGRF